MKRRKGWRMICDVGKVTKWLENELCYDYNYNYNYELCSFSNLYVSLPTSQLILQPFRRFTYVTAHSPTLPLLHLRHSSVSNPSFASPTSQALHLIHLASRPCLLYVVFLLGSLTRRAQCEEKRIQHIRHSPNPRQHVFL